MDPLAADVSKSVWSARVERLDSAVGEVGLGDVRGHVMSTRSDSSRDVCVVVCVVSCKEVRSQVLVPSQPLRRQANRRRRVHARPLVRFAPVEAQVVEDVLFGGRGERL